MICPSCNQIASSWQRNAFSLQGVTFLQSIKGQLKCQYCGVLLRPVKYGRQLWFVFFAFVVFMALIMLFSDRFYRAFGLVAVGIYWVILVVMVCFVFVYAMWKYTVLEKVDDEAPKTP